MQKTFDLQWRIFVAWFGLNFSKCLHCSSKPRIQKIVLYPDFLRPESYRSAAMNTSTEVTNIKFLSRKLILNSFADFLCFLWNNLIYKYILHSAQCHSFYATVNHYMVNKYTVFSMFANIYIYIYIHNFNNNFLTVQ